MYDSHDGFLLFYFAVSKQRIKLALHPSILCLTQWKDPSAYHPQHRAESCQASTWQVDLISHVLSNYVLQKEDVSSLPTFGVQMKTA